MIFHRSGIADGGGARRPRPTRRGDGEGQRELCNANKEIPHGRHSAGHRTGAPHRSHGRPMKRTGRRPQSNLLQSERLLA